MEEFTLPEVRRQAETFAEMRLGAKQDKAGRYIIYHCYHVADVVVSRTNDPVCGIVAILHEVMEDADVTREELLKLFREVIADAVDAVSRRKDESYSDYIIRCGGNDIARNVKISDLEHNMDVTRLNELHYKDLLRLKKYHKAYKYLIAKSE